MTVRVRSAEGGELEYGSLEEAREALAVGLIGAGDQVQLEPGAPWQPVSALGPPRVSPARQALRWQRIGTPVVLLLALAAVGLFLAGFLIYGSVVTLVMVLFLILIANRSQGRSPGAWWYVGSIVGGAVLGVMALLLLVVGERLGGQVVAVGAVALEVTAFAMLVSRRR